MSVTATFSKTSSNLSEDKSKQNETSVVREMKRLMDIATRDELNAIGEYLLLKKQGAEIIGAAEGSVELLIWCRELSGLERLHEWLVNGRVRDIVKLLFNRLLNTTDENKLPVDVEWNEEEYKMCKEYFVIYAGRL